MRRVVSINCVAVVLILMAVAVAAPSGAPTRPALSLPLHTRVTLTGETLGSRPGEHMKGHIYATAEWNKGTRYVVATPSTDARGRWRVTFHPSHRGLYELRILTPDSAVLEYSFAVH